MEQKKSKGKKTGIIGRKKGGTAVAFRPQDIIDAKFDLTVLDRIFSMLFLQGLARMKTLMITLHIHYGSMT